MFPSQTSPTLSLHNFNLYKLHIHIHGYQHLLISSMLCHSCTQTQTEREAEILDGVEPKSKS